MNDTVFQVAAVTCLYLIGVVNGMIVSSESDRSRSKLAEWAVGVAFIAFSVSFVWIVVGVLTGE